MKRTKQIPRMCGVAEVADLLEIKKQNVSNTRKTKGFPEPIQILASGPIWLEDEILNYRDQKLSKRKGDHPNVN